MKIAHINMFYLPTYGGVERVMQELAEYQVKQGHEVHVFCCDSDKYKKIDKKKEVINGVIVHRYPYWFRLSLSTFIWPSLLWNLPKYKYDILHSHVSGHLYVLIAVIVSK
ncbi:MAG: glycosyltransferase, partial [Nanoarchaeota archaeon]